MFQDSGTRDAKNQRLFMQRGWGWLGTFTKRQLAKRPLLPESMFDLDNCGNPTADLRRVGNNVTSHVPMPCNITRYLDAQYAHLGGWRVKVRDGNRRAGGGLCNVWLFE